MVFAYPKVSGLADGKDTIGLFIRVTKRLELFIFDRKSVKDFFFKCIPKEDFSVMAARIELSVVW